MKSKLLALALILAGGSAHAYGPSPIVVSEQNFSCSLKAANGAVLKPTISRILLESRKVANERSLSSVLHLGDGTGVEEGTGNIDRLLKSIFGAAAYDQSSLAIDLETVTADTSLAMGPLAVMTKSIQTAWVADSQDDMNVTADLRPQSVSTLDLTVVFTVHNRSFVLHGTCAE